jgi:hypothetical protein
MQYAVDPLRWPAARMQSNDRTPSQIGRERIALAKCPRDVLVNRDRNGQAYHATARYRVTRKLADRRHRTGREIEYRPADQK